MPCYLRNCRRSCLGQYQYSKLVWTLADWRGGTNKQDKGEGMNSTIQNIFLVVACSVIGLLVLGLVVALFAFRWLQRLVTPDVGAMQRKLGALRAANPTLSNEALIGMIIRQQSFKCGVIGAITGLGGFITLPVALPIDILMSMRIQSAMVQFIALVYNQNETSADELRLQTTLVMSGGVE